jgi:hypothetical protein
LSSKDVNIGTYINTTGSCIFRSETITNSTANRSLIPGQIDH